MNECLAAPASELRPLRSIDPDGLLERDGELDAIAGAVRCAATGSGALVVLEGAAGLGKSALLDEAARMAAESGFELLRAAPGPLERGFSYGVVRALLEAPLHGAPADERERLLTGAAGLAGRLLLGGALPGDAGTMVAHSVFWLCTALTREQPVALLIDDAQWADRDSLAVLTYLARRIEELPLLLVVAARAGDPDAPSDLLSLLAGSRAAAVLRPRPLSTWGGIGLIRRHAPDLGLRESRDAHLAAAGVPWLLEEIGRGGGTGDAVRHRLAALTTRHRAVAGALAVIGADGPPHVVARLAGVELAELAVARDALAAAGLLAPAGLELAHPLIAAAIVSGLAGSERERLHREAARLLAEAGAPAGLVADHLLECGPHGDPEVSRLLAGAADGATADTAAAYLARALDERAPGDDRGGLLVRLAEAEFDAGRAGVRARLREALGETRDHDARIAVLVRLAGLEAIAGGDGGVLALLADHTGDPAIAIALLDALAARPDLRAAELAALDSAEVLDHAVLAHRAWAGVQQASAPAAACASFALEALEGGVLLADAGRRGGYHLAVRALIATDRHADARRAIDALGAAGSVPLRAAAAWYGAELALRTGDVTGAAEAAREALALAPDELVAVRDGATAVLARALAERGELDEARELLRSPASAAATAARARVALLAGDYQTALRAPATAEPSERLTTVALALAHLGRRDKAVKVADAALVRADRFGAPVARIAALHARAVAEADPDARVALLERALEVADGVAAVLETTRVRLELGSTLSRSGARVEARDALRPALADADAVGAVPLAERARRELVATGLRPRQAQTEGTDALTPRQREICTLAAGGKGNREIAQALFLSVKTVETHLAAGYRKLGIASRAELSEVLAA